MAVGGVRGRRAVERGCRRGERLEQFHYPPEAVAADAIAGAGSVHLSLHQARFPQDLEVLGHGGGGQGQLIRQ